MSSYPPSEPPPSGSWPPQPHGDSGGIVGADDRNWAVAGHIGSILTAWVALGLIAPLIVLLARGGTSAWVRRHAVESLNFQINAAVWGIICWILVITLVLSPLALVYVIFYLIVVITATARASAGREYRYPFTVRVIS
ncbi:DUF4870 domain-containing protein [Pseudonocardia sp.]|uniref:DUF4870 domain-containing protein n=1 Tax=Pseudonocardia sp. TaxID=60912 RepID=UPI002637F684|nr:DUF4870 domain-containing protein [Pseudonocardia sp.]